MGGSAKKAKNTAVRSRGNESIVQTPPAKDPAQPLAPPPAKPAPPKSAGSAMSVNSTVSYEQTQKDHKYPTLPDFPAEDATTAARQNVEITGGRCFQLPELLSPSESRWLMNQADELGFGDISWEYDKSYRDCRRVVAMSKSLAEVLWHRIAAHLERDDLLARPYGFGNEGEWRPVGVNECFRFSRYTEGGHFQLHRDGGFVVTDNVRSVYTITVYLNEQLEEAVAGSFTGGELRFEAADSPGDRVAVHPQTGLGVLFNHDVLHEALPVTSGVKYILRTDVMFERCAPRAALRPQYMTDPRYIEAESLYQQSIEAQQQDDPKESTRLYLAAMEIQALLPSLPLGSYTLQLGSVWNLPLQLVLCVLERLTPSKLGILGSASVTWSQVARDGELWSFLFRQQWPMSAPLEAALEPTKFRLPVSARVPSLRQMSSQHMSSGHWRRVRAAPHRGLHLKSESELLFKTVHQTSGHILTFLTNVDHSIDFEVSDEAIELQFELGEEVTAIKAAPEVLKGLGDQGTDSLATEDSIRSLGGVEYVGPIKLWLKQHPEEPLELHFFTEWPVYNHWQTQRVGDSLSKEIGQLEHKVACAVGEITLAKARTLRGGVSVLVPAHLVDWYRARAAAEKCFQPLCVAIGCENIELAHVDPTNVDGLGVLRGEVPAVVALVKGHYWGAGSGLKNHLVGAELESNRYQRVYDERNAITVQAEQHCCRLDISAFEIIVGWAVETWISSRATKGISYHEQTVADFPVLFTEPAEMLVQSDEFTTEFRERIKEVCTGLKAPCLCMVPAPVMALCAFGLLSGVVVVPLFDGAEFVVARVQDRRLVQVHAPTQIIPDNFEEVARDDGVAGSRWMQAEAPRILPCCGLDATAAIEAVLEAVAANGPDTTVLLWNEAAGIQEALDGQSEHLDVQCMTSLVGDGAIAFQTMSDSVDFFESLY